MSAARGDSALAQEDEKKPMTHINLKVTDQYGIEVFFRIKRNTQLKKLMNAYCEKQSKEMNSLTFLFDGNRIRAEQTPDEHEMEEGDEICAMLPHNGGGKKMVLSEFGLITIISRVVGDCLC